MVGYHGEYFLNQEGPPGDMPSDLTGDCAMARDKPHEWYDIEIQFEGKTVKGRYVEGAQ